ncbi:hemerythrin domain-containing protein [Streptomyces sp. BE20]|uniref:hemerythrin domain-containing protein n=1 Tax=Streptomyces sp. BE20 TaxID=3002525 RepID=UPI002E7725A5|nr:hemerythrin domain-containing protein [Streptomyces sp. BE20]MEE1825294.1 hemerythrin domain-containing protein [Streptomyces sp. BE20]
MASQDRDRAAALSLQLARAHDELRRLITGIRTDLGHRRLSDDTLVTHCLAFCAALESHHRGEDDGMFSHLLRERPDLAPTVAKLVEDHGMISSILSRVGELAHRATESRGPALDAIGRELDGLAAVMESHFGYEERAISEALDRSGPAADWPDGVFRFGTA